MPVRKVAEILDNSPGLTNLAAAARRTAELQRLYTDAVPAELSRASRVGWVRPGVVYIAADNGAVAAKLRQLAPRVLDRFRRAGLEFNAMRVEVQVDAGARARARSGADGPLSPAALASIDRSLEALTDSPLKAALARLAQTARRRQSTRSKT